jgi:uncharacterized membrane protein
MLRQIWSLGLALFWCAEAPVLAQDYEIDGISAYYCNQIGGDVTGDRQCSAPYRPWDGDACRVAEDHGHMNPAAMDRMAAATASCSPDAVDDAKAATLAARADLRGYVSAGYDESVNDPVANGSYRPGDATAGPGTAYFAAECAVQTCASGGGGGGGAGGSCPYENDGACDAPGLCPAGTDLADCGGAAAGATCRYENDGACDVPAFCPAGTDLADCAGTPAGGACRFENDGQCDVPGVCSPGTDVADCTRAAPGRAEAGTVLEICFRSSKSDKVYIALGRLKTAWQSFRAMTFEGWFYVAAGECRTFARFHGGMFLYTAHTVRNGKRAAIWTGNRRACVFGKAFEYNEDIGSFDDCAEEERGFIEKEASGEKYILTLRERD